MKITKATAAEKAAYKERDPNNLNTLHSWVRVKADDGTVQRCAVEYLGEGDVNWEVMAPKGYQFERGCHSYLGPTQADVLDRVCGLELDEEPDEDEINP